MKPLYELQNDADGEENPRGGQYPATTCFVTYNTRFKSDGER